MLDKARWAPQSLVTFALQQVKYAVVTGSGILRNGKQLGPGVVTEGDVDMLRRILYAYGGDGSIGVTQPEAEVLFDIDDATCDADNHPSWRDLFVKAIANCVMSASGYAAPAREIALARDAWLDRRGDLALESIVSGMGTGLQELPHRLSQADRRGTRDCPPDPAEDRDRHQRGPSRVAEATWLAERIGRDGRDDAERAGLADVPQGRQRLAASGPARAGQTRFPRRLTA